MSIATILRSRLSRRGLHSQALVRTLLIACLPHAKATTEWALNEGSVVLPDRSMSGNTPDIQVVIQGAFKSAYETGSYSSTDDVPIIIDLKSSKTVTMAYLANFAYEE